MMMMMKQSWASLLLLLLRNGLSSATEDSVIDEPLSVSDQSQRDLRTVHLFINDLGDVSSAWTSNGIRTCPSSGYTSDASSSTTVVQFTYNVETNSSNPGPVEQTIDRRLKNLIVNSVADAMCPSRRNLRMLSNTERKLSLVKVDGSSADQSTGTCQPMVPASKSCNSYASSLNVVSSQGSSKAKVRNRALQTVKNDMGSGVYKKKLNQGLQGTGVSVTNIAFTSPIPTPPPPTLPPQPTPVYVPVYSPVYVPQPVTIPYHSRPVYVATPASTPPVNAAASQSNAYATGSSNGLSTTGKILVAIAALLLLLILLACCWARHMVVMRRKRRLGTTDEVTPRKVARKDDVSTAGQMSEDGESFVSTNMNDLGRYHSKLDVHKCTSATCRACNPHLAKGAAPTLAQIAEGMTTAPPSPDDDISVDDVPPPPPQPPRRGRTRTARPRVQHPITFLKVTSPERDSAQREDEI